VEGFLVCLFRFFFRCFSGFPEIKQYGKILHGGFHTLIELYPILVYLDVFENARCTFIVVPKSRASGKLSFFFYLDMAVGDVKETSSVHPAGTSYRLAFPVS
jgi:hypothetical protein